MFFKHVLYVVSILSPAYSFSTDSMPLPMINSVEQVKQMFAVTPEIIKERVQDAKERALHDLEAIYCVDDTQRTFENTIRAYDEALAHFRSILSPLAILQMISPDQEIRDASRTAVRDMTSFSIDHFSQNRRIYDAGLAYLARHDSENLSSEEKYTLQEMIMVFKHLGFHLPDSVQDKLKSLKKELAQHQLAFNTHIAQVKQTVQATEQELAGLSEEYLKTLKKTDDGSYIIGVDYPTYTHVMANCRVELTRKALWKEFVSRAYPENIQELKKIIELRDEIAKLLGYSNYAELDIDGQMAHNISTVEDFLADLLKRSETLVKQEFEDLTKKLPESVVLTDNQKIKPWDRWYLANYYTQNRLQLNELEISNYFPLDHTITALLDIYQKFFDLTLTKVTIDGLWHEDVQALSVSKDGVFRGYILLDLFPRENKYSHACTVTAVNAIHRNEQLYPGLALVIANFPKPTEDKPALLTRSNVGTFFHEFGHALHVILGATELHMNAGTQVKRDFVELPSQILEEWMIQPQFLKQVSSHYQTGAPLSDELIEKITSLKRSILALRDQIFRAIVSLELFKRDPQENMHELIHKIFDQIMTAVEYQDDNYFYASFGHLMGYGTKYYGYLWSEVYALDLFDIIKQHNFSPEIGQKYIDTVLSKGGSEDPMNLLRNFLGREPRSDAFLKNLGL